MLRLGNWTLVEDRWDLLVANWRAAPLRKRIVLTDNRPAVLSRDETVVTTVPMPVWLEARKKLKKTEDFYFSGAAGRGDRMCEMCNAKLRLTKEFTHAWAFRCEVCKSVEVHGKDKVGGTIGAGETEKS